VTQDEIIEMAEKAKLDKELADDYCRVEYWTATEDELIAFAKLVAAKEREACAKVCDELHWPWHIGDDSGPKQCATAIRARGEA
jgi:hypothetical protein